MSGGDDRLLDTIYAAALEPALWTDVLRELGAFVGSDATTVSRLDIVTGVGAAMSVNNEKRTLADYFAYYYRINPIQLVADPVGYAAAWTPDLLPDEHWLDRGDFERSEYYNDYLRPIEAAWGMSLRLGLAGNDVSVVRVSRSARRGRFEDDEIARIRPIHSHLIRAYRIGAHFTPLHRRLASLSTTVDQAGGAMILLDADGRVVHANLAADRLLAACDVLDVRGGRLVARDPDSGRKMDAAIDHALGNVAGKAGATSDGRRVGGSFTLRAIGRRLPVTGAILPVTGDSNVLFGSGWGAIVSLADPMDATRSTGERAAATFGLTAAERRLTEGLMEGLDLRGIAVRHAVSINTVRSQLAAVFAKTDTSRQIDLVALLMSVDAGRR